MQFEQFLGAALAVVAARAQDANSTAGNLTSVLAGNQNLSALVTLLQASPDIANALGGAQNITLLAPSNDAISALNSSGILSSGGQEGLIQALLNYHVLERWAKENRPNHVFLQFEGSKWTYKQFYLEVQRVGNWLMNDLGIERNEVVALDGGNSCSYLLLWFALEGIGACPAFINCNLTSDSLHHCVKVSRSLKTLRADH